MRKNAGGGLVVADMLAVAAVSALMLAFLVYSACGGEEDAPAPAVAPAVGSAPAAGSERAEWVTPDRPQPVPDWALYPYSIDPARQAPPPPHEAKPQSWHNKLLFPVTKCPYCGRRVPTKEGSYFWLIVGFVGQIGFTLRFVVQWLASERAGASVVPVSFWYLSIVGSLMLLVYAVSIVAWPIILGQGPNVFIYARNLYLIKKQAEAAGAGQNSPDA